MKTYKFIDQEFSGIRCDYQSYALDENDLFPDPFEQFYCWLKEAYKKNIPEFNAFALSTVNAGKPSNRIVLLKALSKESFVFFTNYSSKKGQDIAANNQVAALFFWQNLERQVRIEGQVKKTSSKLSDDYFANRPKGAKIGGIVSNQSQRIGAKSDLEAGFKKLADEDNLQRPNNWGGYEIFPDYFEFWQGQSNRLHDRLVYKKNENNWDIYRLAP